MSWVLSSITTTATEGGGAAAAAQGEPTKTLCCKYARRHATHHADNQTHRPNTQTRSTTRKRQNAEAKGKSDGRERDEDTARGRSRTQKRSVLVRRGRSHYCSSSGGGGRTRERETETEGAQNNETKRRTERNGERGCIRDRHRRSTGSIDRSSCRKPLHTPRLRALRLCSLHAACG
jgi:hypothetical protein